MQLGWIDFSKNERDKVLGVLDSLTEQGTLDELGIAPIRDGFADLFFPGTSTQHTRAKYFLLVPYACKDLEKSETFDPNTAQKRLYETEMLTSEILRRNNSEELGIIGGDYSGRRDWVKRPPSTLYWAGLRRYGILNGNLSLSEYLKAACALKSDRETLKKLGNRNDTGDCDDKDAGAVQSLRFFSVPTYRADWKENLSISLTKEEAEYLKGKIKRAAPETLLVYLLNAKNKGIFECESFEALSAVIDDEKLKADCKMAVDFGKFLYVLRVVYNVVVSEGKNKKANEIIDELRPDLRLYSDIDIEAVFMRLNLVNDRLKKFLFNSKKAMAEGDTDALKILVTERERSIKGASRAKTLNTSPVYADKWIGGTYLDYRFTQAKRLVLEIFQGEDGDV